MFACSEFGEKVTARTDGTTADARGSVESMQDMDVANHDSCFEG